MFEENLAENPQFIRVHKSYIVNFNHLISINKSNGGTIVMTNQMEIPFNSDSYELILEKINLIKKKKLCQSSNLFYLYLNLHFQLIKNTRHT